VAETTENNTQIYGFVSSEDKMKTLFIPQTSYSECLIYVLGVSPDAIVFTKDYSLELPQGLFHQWTHNLQLFFTSPKLS